MRANLQWQDGFASHRDLFPTLYHLALPGASYPAFGRSLFAERPVEERFAVHNGRMIFTQEGMVDIQGERGLSGRGLEFTWDDQKDLVPFTTIPMVPPPGLPPNAAPSTPPEALNPRTLQRDRAVAVQAAQEWYLRRQIAKARAGTNTEAKGAR
jgi:hypothetical protein